LSSSHATQVSVWGSQTGVAPWQSPFVRHPTQLFVAGLQTLGGVQFALVRQPTHVPASVSQSCWPKHAGLMLEQPARQVCMLSQTRPVPHWLSWVHSTHVALPGRQNMPLGHPAPGESQPSVHWPLAPQTCPWPHGALGPQLLQLPSLRHCPLVQLASLTHCTHVSSTVLHTSTLGQSASTLQRGAPALGREHWQAQIMRAMRTTHSWRKGRPSSTFR
jgi:hypothetical protein